jgi:branched-chain amino acid transport system ATP-binding protein
VTDGTVGAGSLAGVFDEDAAGLDELLVMRKVSVRFGGIAALTDISLTMGTGELVAVIGPNGAGKSTMLNAISRVVRSTGQISLAGARLDTRPASEVIAAGLGRSFQDAPLVEDMTVLENVMIGAHQQLGYRLLDQVVRQGWVRRREQPFVRKATVLLDFVGLSDQTDVRARFLPYGARKRLDLARSMLAGPRLLLLDEPSSGLDDRERQMLVTILQEVRAARTVGVLFVEHHMDIVREVATRVVALKAGEILMDGTPQEVLESDTFLQAIMGEETSASPAAAEQRAES